MLSKFLTERRSQILARWVTAIFDAFPSDTSRFLKSVKDQFRNPVGQTLKKSAEVLYDCLVSGEQSERFEEALAQSIRIRAVQDSTAAQSVAFVFLLKNAVRAELAASKHQPKGNELVKFEDRVDGLALEAFDGYMTAKEQIYEVRANEAKRRSYKLLEAVKGTEVEINPASSCRTTIKH